MYLIRTLGVVVAVVGLLAAVPSAEAAKVKKLKEHAVRGVVTAIDKDADKDTSTITLTVKRKDKATQQETTEEKKVKVTKATTFVKVSGKKGNVQQEPAKFDDLQDGDRAAVTVLEGVAVEVKFHAKKK